MAGRRISGRTVEKSTSRAVGDGRRNSTKGRESRERSTRAGRVVGFSPVLSTVLHVGRVFLGCQVPTFPAAPSALDPISPHFAPFHPISPHAPPRDWG